VKLWGIVDGDMKDLRAEIERLRLTDDEKEAIEITIDYLNRTGCRNTQVQTTLRGLLERLEVSDE
jgi:hypothetical protein